MNKFFYNVAAKTSARKQVFFVLEYKTALACWLATRSTPKEKIGSSSLVSTIVVLIVVKTVGKYKQLYKATGSLPCVYRANPV